jgi:hypothetical protein
MRWYSSSSSYHGDWEDPKTNVMQDERKTALHRYGIYGVVVYGVVVLYGKHVGVEIGDPLLSGLGNP